MRIGARRKRMLKIRFFNVAFLENPGGFFEKNGRILGNSEKMLKVLLHKRGDWDKI